MAVKPQGGSDMHSNPTSWYTRRQAQPHTPLSQQHDEAYPGLNLGPLYARAPASPWANPLLPHAHARKHARTVRLPPSKRLSSGGSSSSPPRNSPVLYTLAGGLPCMRQGAPQYTSAAPPPRTQPAKRPSPLGRGRRPLLPAAAFDEGEALLVDAHPDTDGRSKGAAAEAPDAAGASAASVQPVPAAAAAPAPSVVGCAMAARPTLRWLVLLSAARWCWCRWERGVGSGASLPPALLRGVGSRPQKRADSRPAAATHDAGCSGAVRGQSVRRADGVRL